MPESTKSLVFPDINVWLALTHDQHVHHVIASDWFSDQAGGAHFFFCRFTQLGLLRLLTSEAVMGADVMNQAQAWDVYDRWLQDDRVDFLDEPTGLDTRLRLATRSRRPAPKDWADAYLAAFAGAAQFTLVTFDRAMRTKARPVVLLSDGR
jgi:uncharacterized protein